MGPLCFVAVSLWLRRRTPSGKSTPPKASNGNSVVTGNALSHLTVDDSLRSARIKVSKIPETCCAVVLKMLLLKKGMRNENQEQPHTRIMSQGMGETNAADFEVNT